MKKTRKWKYDYTVVDVGVRQYDDVDLSEELLVEARYVPSLVPQDRGNRYIEALPRPRTDAETLLAYRKDVLTYDAEAERQIPSAERKCLVSQIREVRFPLPHHRELEYAFHNALVNSYRNRYQLSDDDTKITVTVQDSDAITHGKLIGDSASSANSGFALLGCSGCGKSASLSILLSNYPQVIVHSDGFGRQMQIVYLVVNCVPNSNFSALYVSIGNAIDHALGCAKSCYEALIARQKTLGGKAEKVRELIELFAIGIIIFDEIQLIDFASTKENSFESLMVLTNRTKVAIAVLGTEDAYHKMFTKLRTARRIGTIISGHMYCDNRQFFTTLVRNLMIYQWFDSYVEPSEALVDALYQNTHGIIDQLIGLYMYMNIDYLSLSKRPTVDADFVNKTANKHYRGMRDLLTAFEDPLKESQRQAIVKQANLEMEHLIQSSSQKDFAKSIEAASSSIDSSNRLVMKKNILHNIQMVSSDYTASRLDACIDRVLNSADTSCDERTLTMKVFQMLQSQKTDRRKTKQKQPEHEALVDFLLAESKN